MIPFAAATLTPAPISAYPLWAWVLISAVLLAIVGLHFQNEWHLQTKLLNTLKRTPESALTVLEKVAATDSVQKDRRKLLRNLFVGLAIVGAVTVGYGFVTIQATHRYDTAKAAWDSRLLTWSKDTYGVTDGILDSYRYGGNVVTENGVFDVRFDFVGSTPVLVDSNTHEELAKVR